MTYHIPVLVHHSTLIKGAVDGHFHRDPQTAQDEENKGLQGVQPSVGHLYHILPPKTLDILTRI